MFKYYETSKRIVLSVDNQLPCLVIYQFKTFRVFKCAINYTQFNNLFLTLDLSWFFWWLYIITFLGVILCNNVTMCNRRPFFDKTSIHYFTDYAGLLTLEPIIFTIGTTIIVSKRLLFKKRHVCRWCSCYGYHYLYHY